jgi:hypothetical protein
MMQHECEGVNARCKNFFAIWRNFLLSPRVFLASKEVN